MIHVFNIYLATVQKRLGDGFYEQKLIHEKIANLTNARAIAGQQLAQISATNLANLNGRISGNDVPLIDRNDLTNSCGTISEIKKGDLFYLDKAHNNNHIEVFNPNGDVRAVLNLDGYLNRLKKDLAVASRRKIRP